ncbi:MAG: HAD family phosphatase [Coriobacteriaceae bacterium]|nr:HAD family phosphatase [Coriobacteriaceae bacterium]
MIKLFATDLDGTLLNLFHQADGTIRRALRTVTDAGAHVAIATGRTMRAPNEFGLTGAPLEAVCANGSIVLGRDGSVLRHSPVDPAFLEELTGSFPGVCFECVGLQGVFVTGSEEDRARGFKRDGVLRRVLMAGMRARATKAAAGFRYRQSVAEVLAQDICKVNARVPDPALERELHAFLDERSEAVVNTPFDPVMFEITDARVSKGEAVAWLAGHLGFTEDEVAVYGDGGNDIAMLSRFEHAFATSNASDAAKRAAGTVIGHCAWHAVPRHMVATARRERAQ